jgi:cytochrome P450
MRPDYAPSLPDGLDLLGPRFQADPGMGKHSCVGNPLARMEAVIAVQVLAQQIDALAVIHPEQLRYNASFMVRGLLELPVRVRRHAGA